MCSQHGGYRPPGCDQPIQRAREGDVEVEEKAIQPMQPSHHMQTRSARKRALRTLEDDNTDPVIMRTRQERDAEIQERKEAARVTSTRLLHRKRHDRIMRMARHVRMRTVMYVLVGEGV
jgi:hypothetical protein